VPKESSYFYKKDFYLKGAIALLILIGVTISDVLAQSSPDSGNASRFQIKAVKIHGDIDLTGKLNDPHWKLAPKVSLDYEIQPGDNTPASQRTEVMVLYNSQYLYIGYDCHDKHPTRIRAHITDRDNIFQDDFIGIIIDTYNDHQRAYEFFVNPYGIQADAMRDRNNEDVTWDAVWYTKASISDSGYTAEMAIPFKSLRFPAKEDQNWGIDFIRVIPRESRFQVSWVCLNLNDPCLLCQTGTLKGLKNLQSTGSFEALPYAMGFESGTINDNTNPNSGFSNGPLMGRVGVGLKYSPNPSISLEGWLIRISAKSNLMRRKLASITHSRYFIQRSVLFSWKGATSSLH
jgi:hypothetical protein